MPVTYDKLATTTLSSAASSVTFSSISGSYTDLVLVTSGTNNTSGASLQARFNGETTNTNYSYTYMIGDGSTAGSNNYTTDATIGTAFTNQYMNIVHFMNYSNTTTYKTKLSRYGNAENYVAASVGLWRSTAAITSIEMFVTAGNFAIGTMFTLYGIKAA